MFSGKVADKFDELKNITLERDNDGKYKIETTNNSSENVNLNISKKEFRAGIIGFGIAFLLRSVMK